MLSMPDPTLNRGRHLDPFQSPGSIGPRHPAESAREPVAVVVPQPTAIRKHDIAEQVQPIGRARHMGLIGMEPEPIGGKPLTDGCANVCQPGLVLVQHHHVVHVAKVRPDPQDCFIW